jgi:integrase
MAGRRPLSRIEERQLLHIARKLTPRDRALVTSQWFTGFRIHEILALTVGHVSRDGRILPRIGVAPRHLKGGYGKTRWIPVLPELSRALRHHLWWLGLKFQLTPDLPLFPSRVSDGEGGVRPISRFQAHRVVKSAFAKAGILDDGRLGTHSLRKTFAGNVYLSAGHDLMVLKLALGHTSVATTEQYLEVQEDRVMAAIAHCDFTRPSRKSAAAA